MIRQAPASLGLGLASTANLPGSGLPLFSPLLRQRGSLPALDGRPIYSPQLTAVAGNYAYTHLQIWANGVSVPPGGCRHYHLDIASVSCGHVDLFSASPLVTLELLGQASKIFLCSAQIADGHFTDAFLRRRSVLRRRLPYFSLTAAPTLPACLCTAGLTLRRWPVSMPLACLYIGSLLLRSQPTSSSSLLSLSLSSYIVFVIDIIIVIVIIHSQSLRSYNILSLL